MLAKQRALENADALLAAGLEEKTFSWWFDFFCLGRVVRIRPVGLVHLVFSTESPDIKDAPYTVVEARIDYRRMSPWELSGHGYLAMDPSYAREHWILSTSGGAEMLIVCDDFIVEESELGDRYPELVGDCMDDWKRVDLRGAGSIERVCGVYEIYEHDKMPFGFFKIKVIEGREGSYHAVANVCFKGPDGAPYGQAGMGDSESEALQDCLRSFMTELQKREQWGAEDFSWTDPERF